MHRSSRWKISICTLPVTATLSRRLIIFAPRFLTTACSIRTSLGSIQTQSAGAVYLTSMTGRSGTSLSAWVTETDLPGRQASTSQQRLKSWLFWPLQPVEKIFASALDASLLGRPMTGNRLLLKICGLPERWQCSFAMQSSQTCCRLSKTLLL